MSSFVEGSSAQRFSPASAQGVVCGQGSGTAWEHRERAVSERDGAVGEDSLPRLSQSLASLKSANKEASEDAEGLCVSVTSGTS